MLTILHMIDTTGPGGAETVYVEMASHMEAGDRSIPLIQGKGWVHDQLVKAGLTPVILNSKGSFNLRYLLNLVRIVRRERIDVIQAHLLGSSVYACLAGFITNVPVVATFHGTVDLGEHERLLKLKAFLLDRLASRIVAVSEGLADYLQRRLNPKVSKIDVIYNGVEFSGYSGATSLMLRSNLGIGERSKLVGSLGNIRPAKAYDTLLEAARSVVDRLPQTHFVIGGQGRGSLYENLRAKRTALGLDECVHFAGFVDDPREFLHGVDCFALSSSSEGFSLATVQALAAGRPVLATRCGGPEEIIVDDETGLLVENRSAEAIATGLVQLLEDPKLAERLANNGRHMALKRFDIRTMHQSYQAIYAEVTGESGTTGERNS